MARRPVVSVAAMTLAALLAVFLAVPGQGTATAAGPGTVEAVPSLPANPHQQFKPGFITQWLVWDHTQRDAKLSPGDWSGYSFEYSGPYQHVLVEPATYWRSLKLALPPGAYIIGMYDAMALQGGGMAWTPWSPPERLTLNDPDNTKILLIHDNRGEAGWNPCTIVGTNTVERFWPGGVLYPSEC